MGDEGCIQLPDDINKLTAGIAYFADRREKRLTIYTPVGRKEAREVKMSNMRWKMLNVKLNIRGVFNKVCQFH